VVLGARPQITNGCAESDHPGLSHKVSRKKVSLPDSALDRNSVGRALAPASPTGALLGVLSIASKTYRVELYPIDVVADR